MRFQYRLQCNKKQKKLLNSPSELLNHIKPCLGSGDEAYVDLQQILCCCIRYRLKINSFTLNTAIRLDPTEVTMDMTWYIFLFSHSSYSPSIFRNLLLVEIVLFPHSHPNTVFKIFFSSTKTITLRTDCAVFCC